MSRAEMDKSIENVLTIVEDGGQMIEMIWKHWRYEQTCEQRMQTHKRHQ